MDVNKSAVSTSNFVVILTDDQGRWAMPHRMPELVMPHVDDGSNAICPPGRPTDHARGAERCRVPDTDGEEFVVVASEYGGARMITDKKHKLVERLDGPGELYDLEQDPDERDNRYDDPSVAEIRSTLSMELQRRFAQQTHE